MKIQIIFFKNGISLKATSRPTNAPQPRPITQREKKHSGRKSSKAQLTGEAAASANEEKLQLLVIGNCRQPWCFKHIKQIPCQHRKHNKADDWRSF